MKNLFLPSLLLTALLTAGAAKSNAQTALYPQLFPLTDVRLNEGPLLRAMQLNDSVLLAYDAGRLMQPYEHEAGIEESGKAFANWSGLWADTISVPCPSHGHRAKSHLPKSGWQSG